MLFWQHLSALTPFRCRGVFMVNPKLEKTVIAMASVLAAIGCLVLIFLPWSTPKGILGIITGLFLSISNFLMTSFLYGSLGKEGRTERVFPKISLIVSMLLTGVVLFFYWRFSSITFWCAVIGVCLVPFAMMLFIVAEVTGLISTNYYV